MIFKFFYGLLMSTETINPGKHPLRHLRGSNTHYSRDLLCGSGAARRTPAHRGPAFSNSHCKTHTSCITTRAAISMWQKTVNLRNLGVNLNAELFSSNTKPKTCQGPHGPHCNYAG